MHGVPDEPVTTPTLRVLQAKQKRRHSEWFIRAPLAMVAQAAPLGIDAAFLYVVLISNQQLYPGQFFGVRPEFEDMVGRDRRWWSRHARTLEQAGLVDVQRRTGCSARYRLKQETKRITGSTNRTEWT
jgi:hypothetical protein